MKTPKPTHAATPGTDASVASKVTDLVLLAYRKNKSKMKTLTESDLVAILERSLGAADQPFQEIEFDPAELEYDPDLDLRPTPPKTAHGRSTPAPAKVKSSGSVPITIRIPPIVLAAFKEKAREMRVPYQTLMKRELGWAVSGL